MLKISLEFDQNAEDLHKARDLIDHLLGVLCSGDAAQSVAAWWEHLGDGSREFWKIAAEHARTHNTWTFADLVAASGQELETLRTYQRNSYRAIKAESAPDPLEGNWENGRMVYRMPDAVRDEILRLAAE